MAFEALDVSLSFLAALADIDAQLMRRDPDLARQLRRAGSSIALNLAEGRQRAGRDRAHCYRIAAGSAAEVTAALDVALAWRHVTPAQRAALDATLDRVRAMLWRLTH
jgi:four helix bundle protein